MATQFTHEVGFYGLVAMAAEPSAQAIIPILATGGSINVSHDPIFTSGVWGAGYYSAAEQVAYAMTPMRIEGDVSFELVAGQMFTALKSFGFENRADENGHNVKVLPQGKAGYVGPAWCSGISFDGSTDSIVSGSFNYSSGNMDEVNWQVGSSYVQPGTKLTTGGHPSGTTPATGDKFLAVYPFWATGVYLNNIQMPDVISWSANYSSEVSFVTLCKGRTEVPKGPDYIMVGSMTADGSFSLFGVNEQLSPDQVHTQKSCKITMLPGNNLVGTANEIQFASIVVTSGGTAVQTGGSQITSDISFSALGDGSKPPMALV